MNRPTRMTRLLGQPRVAAALYVGCVVAVLGWFGGAVPWWLGLMALCFVGTVRKAVNDVRRYKQWSAAWAAMGSAPAPSPRPATAKQHLRGKTSSRWTGAIAAALLLFIIPVVIATPGASEAARNGLTLLWLATAVYLLCKLVINVRPARAQKRAGTVSAGASKTDAAADVVEWALPPASSSPSRADAMRRLPEYCARLLAAEQRRPGCGNVVP